MYRNNATCKNSNTVSVTVTAPGAGSTTPCGGFARPSTCRQGVARGTLSVGSNMPRGGFTPADLPVGGRGFARGITVLNHGERRDEKHCRFPRQLPTNVTKSTRPGPGSSVAQPAQTRELPTSATYSTQKPTQVEDRCAGSSNADLYDAVQNNPNVSAIWLKRTLSNEQETRKTPARIVPIGSKQVCCLLYQWACVINFL